MPLLEFDRQTRPLGPGVLTIGSGPEAGWRVVDYALAPIHAMVTLGRDGRPHLARPRDGIRILVNGVPMEDASRVLQPGDSVTLGEATFHLRAARRHDGVTEAAYLRDMSKGRAWVVGDRLEVGRDVACQVHLADPDVSRVHAELLRAGDLVSVRPKGGIVFLNGARVLGDMELAEGDELGIGRTMLRFTRETPVAAAVIDPVAVAARRPSVGDSRMLRAQTSYMGVVQARESLARERRREWSRIGRYVAIGVGVALAVAALVTGRAGAGLESASPAVREAQARSTGR